MALDSSTQPDRRRTALIVGAGVGGLASGVALGRAGWRVRIFERAPEARAVGFGLSLAPNAMLALRELEIADRLLTEGCVVQKVEIRRPDGTVLKRFNVADALADAVSLFALRPALHTALLDAAPGDALRPDREAVTFATAGSGVVLEFKDGSRDAGDVLIGADGVGSVIRKLLHPQEPAPRSSGYFAIRGVANDAATTLGGLSAVVYLGRGIEAAMVTASRTAVYWYVSMLVEDLPRMSTGPGTLVERCAALLDHGFRDVVEGTRLEDVRVDELYEREPLRDWGHGPVTLLGDAAHPMLPHTGQGAAQALEDAVALGLALGSGDEPVAALRRYEQVRAQRTRPIVNRGRRIAGFTTTKNGLLCALRTGAIRMMPARAAAAGFLLARTIDPHRPLRRTA